MICGRAQTSFKAKHLRRLEELEAEDEAAEGQELLSEEQAEAAEARPTKRPGRAIRSQRPPARQEPLATRSSRDTEARDSPPPPVTRRAGRGTSSHIRGDMVDCHACLLTSETVLAPLATVRS